MHDGRPDATGTSPCGESEPHPGAENSSGAGSAWSNATADTPPVGAVASPCNPPGARAGASASAGAPAHPVGGTGRSGTSRSRGSGASPVSSVSLSSRSVSACVPAIIRSRKPLITISSAASSGPNSTMRSPLTQVPDSAPASTSRQPRSIRSIRACTRATRQLSSTISLSLRRPMRHGRRGTTTRREGSPSASMLTMIIAVSPGFNRRIGRVREPSRRVRGPWLPADEPLGHRPRRRGVRSRSRPPRNAA